MKTFAILSAVSAAAFLGISPLNAAQQNSTRTMLYAGDVTTTSPLAHTITVRRGHWTETFRVDRATEMSIPNRPYATLKDFEFGDKVNVRYQDEAKGVTALSIREKAAS